MIERTTLEIERLREHHRREHDRRHARQDRLHSIDGLLNEFELLNLADSRVVPCTLGGRAFRMVVNEVDHPLRRRQLSEVPIADWMDTLYDLQDVLMPTVETDDD